MGERIPENKMGTMPVGKLLADMAIPMMISMLVQALYNVVDSVFVSRISENALNAVSLAFPLQNLMIAFGSGTAVGMNALLSRSLGAKQQEQVDRAANTGIFLFGCTYVLFALIGAFLSRPFFLAQTHDAEIVGYGVDYASICLIFSFGIFAQFCFERLLQSTGRTKLSMMTQLIGAVINIVLDPILIFGWFGLPRLEVKGAAIATVSAQALSVVFAILLLIKKKLPFTITRHDFRFNTQCPKFLSIGLPLALQEFLTQLSFLALCAFVNRLGLEASSGYGVACKIVNFAMLVPSALMQSMASFVSQNVGAGKVKRAKHTLFTGIGVGLCVGCIVFTLVLLKGDILSGFFSTDAAVIQNSYDYLKGFALESIVTAVLFSMIGYFNGNNQTLWVMTQGLIQTLLVRLPLAYFMSIQPDASLTKIGLAAPVSTIVGIVLNIGYYIYWTRKQQHPPVEEII